MKKWVTNLLSRPGMACRTALRATVACAALYADASGQALAAGHFQGFAQGRNQSQPHNPEAAPGTRPVPTEGTLSDLKKCSETRICHHEH